MNLQYFHVLIFSLIGFGFFTFLLLVAGLFRERGQALDKTPYECGMDPVGSAWVSPNIRFYIFALLFVVFDVEALFVFPWAVQFRALGVEGFVAVMIFVAVLFFGLMYAWKKDALRWE
jgi:NADH:ubiquinone oxidoreductase subunit 3 (subunit A)